ncbi:MAG: MBL fold metallo-hydrolase [Promethearchaeota archaeon]
MRLKYISHACFLLELSGKLIYFDPYKIPKNAEKADIILVSHDHYDHLDKGSVKTISKESSLLILPESCSGKYKIEIKKVKPGDTISLNGISIKAVPAYNPNKRFHPKSNNWVGYIVSDGNISVYHAGDTDLIPEMSEFWDIDFALIPVGDTYTMGFDEAAESLKVMNPKNAIPMHHWGKDLQEFKKICSEKNVQSNIIILKEGEEYST